MGLGLLLQQPHVIALMARFRQLQSFRVLLCTA